MTEMGDAASQALFLKDSSASIKKSAWFMKRGMDEDNMKEALRYSAALLGELRTSLLGPQKYYELYMQACDELRNLEMYFREQHSRGRPYAELYELVQHAGNVLPRLYLLCTVGACYIRSGEAPAKDILRDVVEMCKGVQHATRGLFLRAYLLQIMRGLWPDTGSAYESAEGGNVVDAIEFLLLNFTEMNKLWVRMQHQGTARDKDRREQERQQLADLVGKNLTYLSQLDGLTFPLYRDIVLPRVLDQVVSCKDDIAQQYLMQCVIMVFPDEFHLGTLDALLGALPELQPGVRVHAIMAALLDRLASYATSDASVVSQMTSVDAFGRLSGVALAVVERQPDTPPADVAAMYSALLGFAGTVYPQRLDFVDRVLQTCYNALKPRGPITDGRAEKQVVSLLGTPLDKYDVVTVLGLPNYPHVLDLLRPAMKREIGVRICGALLRGGGAVGTAATAELLLGFLAPLVRGVEDLELDDEEIGEDQQLLARLVHQLRADSPDEQFAVLSAAQHHFLAGGPLRQRTTLPPLAFSALQTVRQVAASTAAAGDGGTPAPAVSLQQWFQFLHATISALALVPAAEMALELFLAAAQAASEEARLEMVAYELFEQAFILYEESIPDSRQQVRALQSIMGALHRCTVFDSDNRAALAHKASAYCSKLLKRPDQCLAVLACSHLYWQEQQPAAVASAAAGSGDEEAAAADGGGVPAGPRPVRDAAGVLSCLKRALKIANAAQQQLAVAARVGGDAGPAFLFVEILNQYLYYYDHGCELVTPAVLQSLLELVATEVSGSEAARETAALQAFHASTLAHIAGQKARGGELGAKYDLLQI